MRKNYFLLFIFSFLLINVGISQITSSASGEWSTGATWVGGVVPTATDDVVIAAGHTISVSDATAVGKSISFGGNDAIIDMNSNARLTVYGDFTLFSTSHVVFSAGWSGTDAKIVFAGDADQILSGWSTTGGSTSFRDIEVNKTGGVLKTDGSNMRLGIQNSLHIINGTFLLNDNDDLEARWTSSGNFTSDANLNITVEANGEFDMFANGYHHIRSGTGLAIGTMTIHGFARFTEDSSNGIYLTAIDVEDGGILQLSPGMAATYFHPGPITIKSGGELSLSSTADIWDGSLVDIQAGGVFSTTASTTSFPANFTENGTILYNRSTDDQNVIDRDYNDLRIELANTGPKNWDLAANRIVGSLSIANGGELVLTSSGGALSLTGNVDIAAGTTLTNNAGASNLILTSTDTENSSLINEGTIVGDLTYERYMVQDEWHLLGSPVTGQTIDAGFLSANNIIGMKDYNVSADDWNTDYTITDPNTPFSLGKGYATKNSTDCVVSLVGTPNSATVNVSLSSAGNGWNLLSNPFTSAINATLAADATNNLLSVNAAVLAPSYAAIYVWDQASTNYKIINNAGDGSLVQDYLQVGQGFFVKSVNPAAGTFDITPAMQSHQASIAFKTAEESSWASITLFAETNQLKTSTQILFREDMSNGLDVGYDAGSFKANSDFALSSRLVEDNGVEFGLQCLPTNYESLIIPIGLNAKTDELIKFSVNALNIPEDYVVILEDRIANKYTILSDVDAEYSVQLTESMEGTGRFFVRTSFESTTGFGDLETKDAFQVFGRVNSNQLIIRGEAIPNTIARIYSITGKQIAVIDLQQSNENSISFDENAGVYIVQISNEQGTFTHKFSWVK